MDIAALTPPEGVKPTPEYMQQLQQQLLAASWRGPKALAQIIPADMFHIFLDNASAVFKKEPTLLKVAPPEGLTVTVVGDTHGQLHDLCNLFAKFGPPSASRIYVFNGDYVDRGAWGVETLLLLIAYKWMLPDRFFMLRGNHETEYCTTVYGFMGELAAKYGAAGQRLCAKVWQMFACIPLAAVVNSCTLILHGGLFRTFPATHTKQRKPQHLGALGDIKLVTGSLVDLQASGKGGVEPDPDRHLGQLVASDVLWSDPSNHQGHRANELRGVGTVFGPDVTEAFLSANNLKLVIRSHEGPDARAKRAADDKMPSVDSGFAVDHDTPSGQLVTLFSAPDYPQFMAEGEQRYRNKGAVLHLRPPDYATPSVESFEAVLPRPEEDIEIIFRPFSNSVYVHFSRDNASHCYVTLASAADAAEALQQLTGKACAAARGRTLVMSYCEVKEQRQVQTIRKNT
eukprot:gene7141-7356_t